jgi:hypothetical protein
MRSAASTYDGLSLAWACANKIKALTLFATHYFELTQLPEKMEGVANVHLAGARRYHRLYAQRAGWRGQQELRLAVALAVRRGDQARAAETARAGKHRNAAATRSTARRCRCSPPRKRPRALSAGES